MHSSCPIDLWSDCTLWKGEGEREEGREAGGEGRGNKIGEG